MNKGTPQAHYLDFFRKICTHNKEGSTINQDLIFRIFEENPNFTRNALITFNWYYFFICFVNLFFNSQNEDIVIEFPSSWSNPQGKQLIPLAECYK